VQTIDPERSARVLVIVTSSGEIEERPKTGIWFTEFSEPLEVFERAGLSLVVASPRGGPSPVDPRSYPAREAIAAARDALALLNATERAARYSAAEFDALFLPGGHGPMFDTVTDPAVKRLVRESAEAGKVIGSVCHGPAGLLNVTLGDGRNFLEGKHVTAYSPSEDATDPLFPYLPFSLSQEMQRQGASYSDRGSHAEYVVVDGNLVTGQNPQSSIVTANAFVDALQAARTSRV
jgi:putative intracellular protease/amidase